MDGEQEVQHIDEQGVMDRIWHLISDEALTIGLLLVAGVAVGIMTTQIAKLGMRVVEGEPKDSAERQRRALRYRFIGLIAGTAWTFMLEWNVLKGNTTFAVSSAAALIAGGLTPTAYDFWRNTFLPWVQKKFGKSKSSQDDDGDGGGGDDESDETSTRFKPTSR